MTTRTTAYSHLDVSIRELYQLVSGLRLQLKQKQCLDLIDKVRGFGHLKIRDRQIIKFKRLLQKQEGYITYPGSRSPNPQLGRRTGSAQSPHSGWSPSPSNDTQPLHPQTTAKTLSWEMLQVTLGTRDGDP